MFSSRIRCEIPRGISREASEGNSGEIYEEIHGEGSEAIHARFPKIISGESSEGICGRISEGVLRLRNFCRNLQKVLWRNPPGICERVPWKFPIEEVLRESSKANLSKSKAII